MRISDWSSDVCSSDMPSAHEKMQCFTLHDDIRVELGVADHETQLRRRQTRDTRGLPAESIARGLVANMHIAALGARHEPPRAQLCAIDQIGRASCRERVWQNG